MGNRTTPDRLVRDVSSRSLLTWVSGSPEGDEGLRHSALLQRSLLANLPGTSVFLLDRELRIRVAQGDSMLRLPWLTEDFFWGRHVGDLGGDVPADILALAFRHCRGHWE